MISTTKAHELDVVELLEDLPEYGLKRGEQGVVVEVFCEPAEAYMLEFVDEDSGESKFADYVKPDQLMTVLASPSETNMHDVVRYEDAFTESHSNSDADEDDDGSDWDDSDDWDDDGAED